MAHQSFTCQTSLLTISDNMWTIFAKSVRAVLYALQTRWESDRRKLVLAYFVSIFSFCLFLRSCLASNLHWMIVMGFEDGMSLMSFALALLYLHASNGAPLALLAKYVAASPEDSPEWPATEIARNPILAATRQPVRLFCFAM